MCRGLTMSYQIDCIAGPLRNIIHVKKKLTKLKWGYIPQPEVGPYIKMRNDRSVTR